MKPVKPSTPDRKTPEPKLPGEESEDIRKGAKEEDHLEKLKPGEEKKVPDKIGTPPPGNGDKQE